MEKKTWDELFDIEKLIVESAIQARKNAYAIYSNFLVGATVLSREGEIYPGCNCENVSYGGTVCAERVALHTANTMRAGDSIVALALVAGPKDSPQEEVVFPCLICLQTLVEFAHRSGIGKDMKIILSTPDKKKDRFDNHG